jgi:hypothetical protein
MVSHETLKPLLDRCDGPAIADSLLNQVKPSHVVFSRFGLPVGVAIAERARRLGIPTIYHLDDDLLHVPNSLGTSLIRDHGQSSIISARAGMMAAVDIIAASTAPLEKVVAKAFPPKPTFVGPAPPILPLEGAEAEPRPRRSVIGYMGSRGHQRDLDLVKPALLQIMAEVPQLEFETFGTVGLPTEIAEAFPSRSRSCPATGDYRSFQFKLRDLAWAVGLAPLIDDGFNRCRTPVKFLEYTAAGIPTLASDCSVYRLDGAGDALRLVGSADWYTALCASVAGRIDTGQLLKAARDFCGRTYPLSRTADDLLKLLLLRPA